MPLIPVQSLGTFDFHPEIRMRNLEDARNALQRAGFSKCQELTVQECAQLCATLRTFALVSNLLIGASHAAAAPNALRTDVVGPPSTWTLCSAIVHRALETAWIGRPGIVHANGALYVDHDLDLDLGYQLLTTGIPELSRIPPPPPIDAIETLPGLWNGRRYETPDLYLVSEGIPLAWGEQPSGQLLAYRAPFGSLPSPMLSKFESLTEPDAMRADVAQRILSTEALGASLLEESERNAKVLNNTGYTPNDDPVTRQIYVQVRAAIPGRDTEDRELGLEGELRDEGYTFSLGRSGLLFASHDSSTNSVTVTVTFSAITTPAEPSDRSQGYAAKWLTKNALQQIGWNNPQPRPSVQSRMDEAFKEAMENPDASLAAASDERVRQLIWNAERIAQAVSYHLAHIEPSAKNVNIFVTGYAGGRDLTQGQQLWAGGTPESATALVSAIVLASGLIDAWVGKRRVQLILEGPAIPLYGGIREKIAPVLDAQARVMLWLANTHRVISLYWAAVVLSAIVPRNP